MNPNLFAWRHLKKRCHHILLFCQWFLSKNVTVQHLFLFIVTSILGVCNCSMFCCTLLYVHSSIAIIFMGKRELIALLNVSSWCHVMVERLFLTVPRGCLQFVIVVFPDHTHLLFFWRSDNVITFRSLHACAFLKRDSVHK